MNKEEIEGQAKRVHAAAGHMASRGVAFLTGPSVVAFGLVVVLAAVLSAPGQFIGFCIFAALGWQVWHIYRRSLTLTIDMKDDEGRKILFDLKRGDFSGPSLPVQALNEMVESLNGMRIDQIETESPNDEGY